MITGVWHTSWTVSDLDRSIAFYRDLLGFELIDEKRRVGKFIERVVGFDGAILRIAFLKIPDAPATRSGHHLELIEYVAPKGNKLKLRTCDVGGAHLALMTNSIHETYERLSSNGVTFVSEPLPFEAGALAGGYVCYLRDPDEFTIELVQLPTAEEQLALGAGGTSRND